MKDLNPDALNLEVRRDNLRETRLERTALPPGTGPGGNSVLLRIGLFSFTSNNITYAAVGDSMHYWNFFPAEDGWGKVPCWGFADIVHSSCEGLQEGERVYGYFPMSTHLMVKAGRINDGGFYDVSPHRLPLPAVYNHYVRTRTDPGYRKEYEGLHCIFQPLFATSFLLDDYLWEQKYFGAEDILATSASSKTAIAFAYLMHRLRGERKAGYRILGLTSSGNADFVRGLGIYDTVLTYDALDGLDRERPSLIVDFAGNKSLLLGLEDRLGESLRNLCTVGLSHWENSSAKGSLKVRGEFFFAPAQAEKRTREWGGPGLRVRMAEVYMPFLSFASQWMRIRQVNGGEALRQVYNDMIEGKVDPAEGIVATL